MATMEYKGIEDYAKTLRELFEDTQPIIERAVYRGAAVVADEIKEAIRKIPIEEGDNGLPPVGTSKKPLTGISRRQKGDLIKGFGLAPIKNDGDYIQTKAGEDGYGSVRTKAYPKGTPNTMLMRSIESGTSFRKKHPTFRPATNRARKWAQAAMEKEIDDACKQLFE